MSNTQPAKGQCLCGAVKIIAKAMSRSVGACHCSMCRRWGGGPLLVVNCGSDISFEGEEQVRRFSSSEWAERGFCSQCGSHLFYRLKQADKYIMMSGVFDDAEGMVFDHQVFIDEKPAHYEFANETKNMTGAEVVAMFAPPQS